MATRPLPYNTSMLSALLLFFIEDVLLLCLAQRYRDQLTRAEARRNTSAQFIKQSPSSCLSDYSMDCTLAQFLSFAVLVSTSVHLTIEDVDSAVGSAQRAVALLAIALAVQSVLLTIYYFTRLCLPCMGAMDLNQALSPGYFSPVILLALPMALSLWSCVLFGLYRLLYYAQNIFQDELCWLVSPLLPTTIIAATTLCTFVAIGQMQQIGAPPRV